MSIVEKIKKNTLRDININIWDDYYEDGYVPDGEKLETFIYIEDYEFSDDEKTIFLEYFKNAIDELKLPNIKTRMSVYDTKIEYPNLNFEELQMNHWSRPEIRIENLSHNLRHELLKELQNKNLTINNKQFNIYSDS